MPNICIFPGCKSYATDNGLCVSHGRVYKPEDLKGIAKTVPQDPPSKPKADKPAKKKAIKKRGKKMTSVMNEVKKLYPIFLKNHPACEIKSPDCIKRATCIHHVKGRGKKIADQSTWKSSCGPCNSYVEANHQWAADNGFKVSQHKIEQ